MKRNANEILRLELSKIKTDYGLDKINNTLITYMNTVLGESTETEEYWQNQIFSQLENYFRRFFFENELESFLLKTKKEKHECWFRDFVLNKQNYVSFEEDPIIFLYKYLTEKLHIEWSSSSWDSFSRQSSLFQTPEPFSTNT